LIFACSGCVDVGEIADRAARKMTKEGAGKMFCLAGIGGRIEPIIQQTKAASKILALDGCQMDCVKSCLEQAGFGQFEHLRVTDLGMEKGKAPVDDENIDKVAAKAEEMLS
jgi:uncharacterized metal-binding protein